MIIELRKEDIVLFLAKQKQQWWGLEELAQALYAPKHRLYGMIVTLRCQGYLKIKEENFQRYYSLVCR